MPPLTQQAQEFIARHVRSGELVVDATAGNGRDTEFLARLVGPFGRVIAIDIQAESLELTAARLDEELRRRVELIEADHALLSEVVRERAGNDAEVAAVMFNLGYRPGGATEIATSGRTTMAALGAAMSLLRAGGVITVIVYRGHPGGRDESLVVESLLHAADPAKFHIQRISAASTSATAPVLFTINRCDPNSNS